MTTKLSRPISVPMVRRVWAAFTAEPQSSMRTIAKRIGISFSTVKCAVQVLESAGYITSVPQRYGTRQVIVPFVTTGDDAA